MRAGARETSAALRLKVGYGPDRDDGAGDFQAEETEKAGLSFDGQPFLIGRVSDDGHCATVLPLLVGGMVGRMRMRKLAFDVLQVFGRLEIAVRKDRPKNLVLADGLQLETLVSVEHVMTGVGTNVRDVFCIHASDNRIFRVGFLGVLGILR